MRKLLVLLMGLLLLLTACSRGALRDRIAARRAAPDQQQSETLDDGADGPAMTTVPPGVQVVRDIAYGSDKLQRFDVYRPDHAISGAPVVVMVHGGGWSRGDKSMATVVQNKVARWVPRGVILVSVNYRMLPGTLPLGQAGDVAHALAKVQQTAATWGGDAGQIILMGHSAGAHLVALLAASPSLAKQAGVAPWLGTVALDSAALDVVKIMEKPHLRLYDPAFGTNPADWQAASPYHVLTERAAPMLLVCSTRRAESCPQAEAFAAKAASLGTKASVLKEDLSHREINDRLGGNGAYTDAVESFMQSLDASFAPGR